MGLHWETALCGGITIKRRSIHGLNQQEEAAQRMSSRKARLLKESTHSPCFQRTFAIVCSLEKKKDAGSDCHSPHLVINSKQIGWCIALIIHQAKKRLEQRKQRSNSTRSRSKQASKPLGGVVTLNEGGAEDKTLTARLIPKQQHACTFTQIHTPTHNTYTNRMLFVVV